MFNCTNNIVLLTIGKIYVQQLKFNQVSHKCEQNM